jgi:hypothetical protein
VEQEQWLREMASQGLHLQKLNLLQRWTFVQGAPEDVAYRVDFNGEREGSAFNNLLEDAGWELAAGCSGWQYWRRANVQGQMPEVFTDSDSKMGKFKRLLMLLLVGLVAQLPLSTMVLRTSSNEASMPVTVMSIGLLSIYAYMGLRLVKRICGMQNKEVKA